jgi:hypothetical protein
MGKNYRTAQGRHLDIEKLRLQNELTPAIGNMRVNARGDQLGPGGRVVKSREQMLDDHYKSTVSKKSSNKAGPDVVPTKGGKTQRTESFEPGNIEPDSLILEFDEFEDPIVEENPTPDKTTGVAAGEKVLKGGLARAIAKTQEYESKKNKPKRL